MVAELGNQALGIIGVRFGRLEVGDVRPVAVAVELPFALAVGHSGAWNRWLARDRHLLKTDGQRKSKARQVFGRFGKAAAAALGGASGMVGVLTRHKRCTSLSVFLASSDSRPAVTGSDQSHDNSCQSLFPSSQCVRHEMLVVRCTTSAKTDDLKQTRDLAGRS